MCRLYAFRANELTKVECSLVHAQNALLVQSRSDARDRTHADGWGIACYGNPDSPIGRLPELVRHETAAFADTHFSHAAESTYAQAVIAHVRLATVGYVGPLNSHPFTHDGWAFAHNGTLPGFEQLSDQLALESGKFQYSRLGNTDSEQLFLWLLSRCAGDGVDLDRPSMAAVEESLCHSVALIVDRCHKLEPNKTARISFVLTNGRLLLACRWNNPLFLLARNGVHDCEICGIPHIRHDDSVDYRAVMFASEPITSEAWQEVSDGTLCMVDEQLKLTCTSVQQRIGS